MKLLKSFVSILFLTAVIFPQSEDVEIDNRVYNFVERMHVQGFVQSYNNFSLPVSRRMIAAKLQEIYLKKEQLSVNDNKLLQQFTVEFENELTDTLIQTAGIFNKGDYRFGNTNRYLYYSKEKSKGSLFVSVYGSVDYYQNENNSLSALNIGGIVRGTLADHFGYYVYGSNGKISGSKSMTRYSSVLRNSYKLAEKAEETFFDDTRGYVTFESGDIKVKYGRDYQLLGSGWQKNLISGYAPAFDLVSVNFAFDRLSYNFFHGRLLGIPRYASDSIQGQITTIPDKFIASHRLQFLIGKSTKFGVGEIIIYSNRSADFSYMNPLVFFKSIEHSNRDRDNAMLYFDLSTVYNGIKPYAMLLLDDIDYSKIGTGWYGNSVLWNTGVSIYTLNSYLPLDINLDYLEIQPYVFSHRINENNFTNFGSILGFPVQPNSRLMSLNLQYRMNDALTMSLTGQYVVHGRNEYDKDGTIIRNNGGDVALGHRQQDATTIHLLDGNKEYLHRIDFSVIWEPFYDVRLKSQLILGDYNFVEQFKKEKSLFRFSIETKL